MFQVTDVFVYLAKTMVDTHYSKQTQIPVYLLLLVSQIFCRIYIFTMYALKTSFVESRQILSKIDLLPGQPEKMAGWAFFNFLLFILLVLHLYWLVVIVKIGLYLLYTGTSRDLQVWSNTIVIFLSFV